MTDGSTAPNASPAVSGTLAADYEQTLVINAAPDAVFESLTSLAGISGWWSAADGSATTGGDLIVRFGERRKFIHVDETVRPTEVRWSVEKSEPSPEWKGTGITFALTPERDDQTQLHLRHFGLTPALDCYGDCSAGWAFVLGSLANYVESGNGSPYTVAPSAYEGGDQ